MKKKHIHKFNIYIRMLLAFLFLFQTFPIASAPVFAEDAITGCANSATKKYNGKFDATDFDFDDVYVGENDQGLFLNPNKGAINPNEIIIDKQQEVWATYFYEGAGYKSDFGWMLYNDAVDTKNTEDKSDDEFLGWDEITKKDKALRDSGKDGIIHPIFVHIVADAKQGTWETATSQSKPVFDKAYGDPDLRSGEFPVDDEAAIADITKYNDGTDVPFVVDNDGVVDAQDMRKSLGTFEAGTELIFFLTADHRWYTDSKKTYFTKTTWNPDNYDIWWKFYQKRNECNSNDEDECSYDCLDECLFKIAKTEVVVDKWWNVQSSSTTDYDNCQDACENDADCIDECRNAYPNSYEVSDKNGNQTTITTYRYVHTDCFENCKTASNKKDCIKACYAACPDSCFTGNQFYCTDFPNCGEDRSGEYNWYGFKKKSPYETETSADENSAGWVNFTKSAYNYSYSYYPDYEQDTTKNTFGEIKSFTTTVKFDPSDEAVTFRKRFKLSEAGGGSWKLDGGWLGSSVYTIMKNYHGVEMKDTDYAVLPITNAQKYDHVIVGSPKDEPDQWILGWEDLPADGGNTPDDDYEDMVFRIEIEAMGTAQLKQSEALTPADDDAVYTAITIKVADYQPCGDNTNVDYYLALDGGVTEESWKKVQWDYVYKSDATGVQGDNIGLAEWEENPELYPYTYRIAYYDFADLGITGRELVWKAELSTKNPDLVQDNVACVPQIIDVELIGDAARSSIFSRSSPIIKTNVVYSGTYETPDVDWGDTEQYMRGHLVATRIYDPAAPTNEDGTATDTRVLWDAGAQLSKQDPATRKIYYPDISYTKVTDEVLLELEDSYNFEGDPVSSAESWINAVANTTIAGGSLEISVWEEDGDAQVLKETFYDKHTDLMEGDNGGTGTINRFTGEFTLNLGDEYDVIAIKAKYTYYTTGDLKEFSTTNVNADLLNLTDEFVFNDSGKKYVDDIDGDGTFNAVNDAAYLVNWIRGYSDNGTTAKNWLLGAVDHASPAIVTAPGRAAWYETLSESEKDSYDQFILTHQGRRTLVLIGALDGMLHAFDGGHFRWGAKIDGGSIVDAETVNDIAKWLTSDNPSTEDITEYRGYFEWDGDSDMDNASYTYGSGNELWAFIPANLISRFKVNFKKSDGDQSTVDASPAVADVYIGANWKTVVLSAEGNGGDTVFCLDITDTDATPKFMWEYTDPDLYQSNSSPAVAKLNNITADGKAAWVTFFVSGKTTSCVDSDTDQHCFPSVFIIDIGTGELLKRVFLTCEQNGVNGVPSGQPALIDFDGNGYVDRMYIGSDKGYLYRVNLPENGGDITHCVINQTLEDANTGRKPIYASPTVIVNENEKTHVNESATVFFGTSDDLRASGDTNGPYTFYAYTDSKGIGGCGAADLDWHVKLPAGQKVYASAFASAGKVYFGTTTQDTEDPCSAGFINADGEEEFGSLYIVDIVDGPSDMQVIDTGNIRSSPVVEDEHVYFMGDGASTNDAGNLNSIGSGQYNNEMKKFEIEIPGELSAISLWWKEIVEDE